MKTILSTIIFLIIGIISINAQDVFSGNIQNEKTVLPEENSAFSKESSAITEEISSPEIAPVEIKVEHQLAEPRINPDFGLSTLQADSMHLPLLNDFGQVPSYSYLGIHPMYWGGFSSWRLHKGLNVNIGVSVFAEFGKHARHGAGFGQNVALQFATPITDKLSLSVGGYLNNVFWQHDSYRNLGLSAVLGYKFNEKWEAYVYGQKSIVQTNNFIPRPLYYWDEVGDKIGAAVKYNFSEAFSVQLSIEEHIYPQSQTQYFNPQMRNAYPFSRNPMP